MKTENLHMNVKKREQEIFLLIMHTNIVVIVDVFAVKYAFGLQEKNYLNAHILGVEEVVQNALEDVVGKHI